MEQSQAPGQGGSALVWGTAGAMPGCWLPGGSPQQGGGQASPHPTVASDALVLL